MIRGVKALPLKNDPDRTVNLAQSFLMTIRADR